MSINDRPDSENTVHAALRERILCALTVAFASPPVYVNLSTTI